MQPLALRLLLLLLFPQFCCSLPLTWGELPPYQRPVYGSPKDVSVHQRMAVLWRDGDEHAMLPIGSWP